MALISEKLVSADETWVQTAKIIGSTPIRPSDFRIGRTVCLGTQTRRKRQRVGKNVDGALAPVCSVILITGAGGMFRRRFARFRHRQGTRRQMADLGIPVLLGLFPCRLGTAYRARFGTRRPDHRAALMLLPLPAAALPTGSSPVSYWQRRQVRSVAATSTTPASGWSAASWTWTYRPR
ncbi:GntP protein [Neisseria meningitidis]|nr:GntP protein [Neisseria meningitidis]